VDSGGKIDPPACARDRTPKRQQCRAGVGVYVLDAPAVLFRDRGNLARHVMDIDAFALVGATIQSQLLTF
jgi:hypothetical protein